MSDSHIASNLPLSNFTIPIVPNETAALFHYDISPNSIQGHKPLGSYADDSCVLYYDMSDTFTNSNGTYVVDKSKYSNSGKLYGPTVCNGRNGKALSFDGTDDYIKTNISDFSSLTNCTVSFWLKLDTVKGWLIAKGQSNSYFIMATSGGTGSFYHNNIGTFTGTIYCDGNAVTAPVGDINWHHYVMSGVNLSSWTELSINNYNGWHLNGTLDKFIIYNKALSEEEVQAHYNEGTYTLTEDGKYGGAIAIEEGTENYILDAKNMSGWGSYSNGNDGTFITEFNTVGYKMINRNSWNGIYKDITVPSTGTYTFSAWFKYIDGTSSNNGATVYITGYGGGDTCIALDKSKKGEWQKVSHTIEVIDTSLRFYIISFGGNSSTDWSTWQVTKPQVEKKSFPTSFVNGSREDGKLIYNLPELMNNDFTISMWAKCHDSKTSSNYYLDNNHQLYLMNYGTNITLRINSGGALNVVYNDARINEWVMLTVVRSEDTYFLYVDGNLIGSQTKALTLTSNLYIGTNNSSGSYFNGKIDELRIDTVARTEEEIKAWHCSSSPFFPRGIERIII